MVSTCNCSGMIQEDDPRYAVLDSFIEQRKGSEGITVMVLQEAQQLFGYLPLEVHKHISHVTGIPVAELYGVSTFYSQFTTIPQGKHKVHVCMGTACYIRGAQKVLDKVTETLGIAVGTTTEDMLFTLEATRCLGCCGLAPVMMIDEDVYANLVNVNEVPGILASYKKEAEIHAEQ